MQVIYWLIPLSIAVLIGAIALFFWAVRSGQFQDLDSPAVDILFNDDLDVTSPPKLEEARASNHQNTES